MTNDLTESTSEDFWEAFRYVTGELSPEDSAAFEKRLESNLILCEAVAEVSTLLAAVATTKVTPVGSTRISLARTVEPVPAVPQADRGSTSGRSIVAAMVSLCCCLAFLISLVGMPDGASETEEFAEASVSDAELLVAAWVESVDPAMSETRESVDAVEEELEVPDWMLAGLTLADLDEGHTMEMPDDMEL